MKIIKKVMILFKWGIKALKKLATWRKIFVKISHVQLVFSMSTSKLLASFSELAMNFNR